MNWDYKSRKRAPWSTSWTKRPRQKEKIQKKRDTTKRCKKKKKIYDFRYYTFYVCKPNDSKTSIFRDWNQLNLPTRCQTLQFG